MLSILLTVLRIFSLFDRSHRDTFLGGECQWPSDSYPVYASAGTLLCFPVSVAQNVCVYQVVLLDMISSHVILIPMPIQESDDHDPDETRTTIRETSTISSPSTNQVP